jgi:hypothetical protein
VLHVLCVISQRVQTNSLIKSGESTFILVAYNPTLDNWCQKLTDFNKGNMESQQIVELLLSMQAKMDANIKAYHEEMMAMVDTYQERMMACLGKTEADTEETEPDPGMMQTTEEHQEIPKGEAAVMPVGEPRKRCRVRSLAAERGQKRKERTRGNRGSRRKSAAACRKVSHCARVAWHRKSVVRNIGTQENCGPRKEFAAAGIRRPVVQKWYGARDAVMKGRRSNGNDGRLRPG